MRSNNEMIQDLRVLGQHAAADRLRSEADRADRLGRACAQYKAERDSLETQLRDSKALLLQLNQELAELGNARRGDAISGQRAIDSMRVDVQRAQDDLAQLRRNGEDRLLHDFDESGRVKRIPRRPVELPPINCPECAGTGAVTAARIQIDDSEPCEECGGSGVIQVADGYDQVFGGFAGEAEA